MTYFLHKLNFNVKSHLLVRQSMTGIQIHVDPKLFGSLDLDLHRNQCRSTTLENRVAVKTVNVWYLCVISCLLNGVTCLIKKGILAFLNI
jgi:hypothetical protein